MSDVTVQSDSAGRLVSAVLSCAARTSGRDWLLSAPKLSPAASSSFHHTIKSKLFLAVSSNIFCDSRFGGNLDAWTGSQQFKRTPFSFTLNSESRLSPGVWCGQRQESGIRWTKRKAVSSAFGPSVHQHHHIHMFEGNKAGLKNHVEFVPPGFLSQGRLSLCKPSTVQMFFCPPHLFTFS